MLTNSTELIIASKVNRDSIPDLPINDGDEIDMLSEAMNGEMPIFRVAPITKNEYCLTCAHIFLNDLDER